MSEPIETSPERGPRAFTRPEILVTGLSGLIGARLAALGAAQADLVPLDRRTRTDVADPGQLAAAVLARPAATTLIHLAAFTDVSAAHAQRGDRRGECWQTNVVGTENVARICAARGLHLIHVSTDFVFDGAKPGAYTEEDRPSPIEWYGETKLAAEKAVERAPAWTILRVSYPYSPEPAPRPDLARKMAASLAEGRELKLFTDQIITPTFADDIARGILLAARMRPSGEVFHLCGSTSLTPFDLGLKVARVFGHDERLVQPSLLEEFLKKDPRPRQRRLRMSNAKWSAFAARHGLDAPLGIDEGLARVRESLAKS